MAIYAYREERLLKTQKAMKEKGFDGLFLVTPGLIRYYTGIYISAWTGNCGVLIPSEGKMIMVSGLCDRDMERIREESVGWIKDVRTWNPRLGDIPAKSFTEVVKELISEQFNRNDVLGVLYRDLPSHVFMTLKEHFPELTLRECDKLVNEVTSVCDEEELVLLRRAAAIADAGMEAAINVLKPGVSELYIAATADYAMRNAGATYNFDATHVCSGSHILMEYWPTEKIIQKGDIVKIDLHPTYQHYGADLCSTFILGKPTPEYRKMCEVTAEAAQEMINMMVPGKIVSDLDDEFRKTMKRNGYEQYCRWSMGHSTSTGYRAIWINGDDMTVLRPNMVICANAFCFKPKAEGIMLEHMVLVKDGKPEVLNKMPLNLIEL